MTAIEESRSRINSMALVHEQLYRAREYAQIDFGDYIDQLASTLFIMYQVEPARVELKISAEDIYLDLEKAIPCGLLLNELITNSLKYAFPDKRKGKLWIKLRPKKEIMQLTVGDDGVGIPEDFDFETSQSLGLQLVNLLTIHDLQEKLHLGVKKGHNSKLSSRYNSGMRINSMSKSNIMVVEDSGIVLLDIQKNLKALGYTVIATASSKEEAIRKADETRPDLVLMDIRLGEELGGIEAADHIREHFNIPIVFLTGYADEDTFQRAKITDPFGYILKPFDPKGLRTTIEIALHNHELKSKLRESEERYRTLIETMNDGVGQVDAEGKIIFANDTLCQMFGLTSEELVGREHASLFLEERQDTQRKEFEARKEGISNSFETALTRKDGTVIPVILSGSPVFDQSGEFAGSIGVFTDISDRKRAEDEVKRSKEALEEAERQVHMGHYEIDAETGKAIWSEEIFKIFGIDPKDGEPTTETYDKLLHIDDRKKVNDLFAESIKKGIPFDLVYRIIRSDGEIRFVHSSARTIKDKNGNAKMFRTLQDITQLKQVEFALQESEERYRTLFENSPIAIWEEDFSEVEKYFSDLKEQGVSDFRDYFEKNSDKVSRLTECVEITNINETSVGFFRATSKEDFPEKLSHYSTQDVLEVFQEEFIALAEGQTKFNSEIVVQDLAGRKRTLFLDLAVAPAYERKLDRVLVSFIDITERKQAEDIMLARYRLVRKSLTESMPELLQATLDETELLTDSNIRFFHFVDADQINLSLQAWSTNTLQNMCTAEGKGLHYPIDQAGVWVDGVRERRPVIHNDYELLEYRKELPEGHAEIKRELVVPVMRGDKIVAIIGVGNKETEYTRKDIEVVSLLADLAWDIVERKQTEAALHESEALYHDLVETAQDLIWQCDKEGRYVYLNPAWEAVFGYQVEEMLGKSFEEFQDPEYAERDWAVYENILVGESVNKFETVHIGKDSRKIYLVFNAKAVYDAQGNAIGTRGTAYDITDRKQAEDALKKNEYLLRESQKIAHQGHYMLDITSGMWESSERLNELFGIDWDYKSDVDGWLNIVHPDDRAEMATYFAEEVIKKRRTLTGNIVLFGFLMVKHFGCMVWGGSNSIRVVIQFGCLAISRTSRNGNRSIWRCRRAQIVTVL